MTFEAETDNSGHTQYRVITFDTSEGPVTIHLSCPPDFSYDLKLDPGLGHFAHYSSIILKPHVFEGIASRPGGRVLLALRDARTLVAYAACWYPEDGERWSKLGHLMYEMGAIEVSRNLRHFGLAHTMLKENLADPFFERKIAYMNGFSWHWDLDGTGLSMTQYRMMLLKFLKKHGFQEYYTNEPNIALRARSKITLAT